jgi:hypothetical protein
MIDVPLEQGMDEDDMALMTMMMTKKMTTPCGVGRLQILKSCPR